MDPANDGQQPVKQKIPVLSKGECFGLSALEIRCGNNYLASNPSVKVKDIPKTDASKMAQLVSLGASIAELGLSFPKYELGLIVVVAARSGWLRLRDKNRSTIQTDLQTKILKASVDSMEFLTSMISATSQKYAKEFKEYLSDPQNKDFPDLKISNVKDFKDLLETMQKMVVFTTQAGTDKMIEDKTSHSIDKFKSSPLKESLPYKPSQMSISDILANEKKAKAEAVESEVERIPERESLTISDTIDRSKENSGPVISEAEIASVPSLIFDMEENEQKE